MPKRGVRRGEGAEETQRAANAPGTRAVAHKAAVDEQAAHDDAAGGALHGVVVDVGALAEVRNDRQQQQLHHGRQWPAQQPADNGPRATGGPPTDHRRRLQHQLADAVGVAVGEAGGDGGAHAKAEEVEAAVGGELQRQQQLRELRGEEFGAVLDVRAVAEAVA